MRTSLYISAETFMRMEADGELSLSGESFTLDGDDRTYEMQPAVRFIGVLSGDDEAGYVGQVLPVAEVVDGGGEHYQDSVLVGEVAYQVEEGFLGTPPPALATAGPAGDRTDTGELLRKGLLQGLSGLSTKD